MAAPRKISFGFLLYPIQALDMVGPMDCLVNASTGFVTAYAQLFASQANGNGKFPSAEELISRSLDITFHHVSEDMKPVQLTGGFLAAPTCTFADCPKLDYLLVGGTDPEFSIKKMPESMKEFLRKQSTECKAVFATCTGAYTLAGSGILDGQSATVNHAFLDFGAEHFPKVKWNAEKNWVVSDDRRFWTAGGACAGMDMMSEWIKEQAGQDILNLGTVALEYQPRDVNGKTLGFMNGRSEWVPGSA